MTTALSSTRRDADEVRPFNAPASFFENLQRVLVDLIELHLVSSAPPKLST
jgi:starvation-inducible DNA-binding protein